ncbi:MAG: L,D-transpeptidase family protein [Clostridia bacterium]
MGKKSFILLLFIVFSTFAFYFTAEEKNLEHSDSDLQGGVKTEIYVNSKEVKKDNREVCIKVYKKLRILELYCDDKLLGRFKIALGHSPEGDKCREGDSKTPEGQYYICTRNESSKFTLFLGLSYPNTEDAELGLKNNIISQEEFNMIKRAEEYKQRPPWNTELGGEIGLHGGGNTRDWTQGCIALSDEDIILIGKYVISCTPVQIFE